MMTPPCGSQPVKGKQRQRGRAIDQHEIVFAGDLVDGGLELALALVHLHQVDLGAGQFAVGRQYVVAAGLRTHARLFDTGLADEHLVQVGFERTLVDAAAHGGVALRIEIDQQHPLLVRSQASRKVDGGGGLADAALLVGDAEHAGGLAGRYVFHMFP